MSLLSVKSPSKPETPAKKVAKAPAAQTASAPFNMLEYFKGIRTEWQRIQWPTRPQVIAQTGVVVVIVTLFSLFVYLVDKIFQWIIQWIT